MRPLLPLLAGLTLGSTATFAVLHFRSAPPPPATSAAVSSAPCAVLLAPGSAPLPTDQSRLAIATWLAQSPSTTATVSAFAARADSLRALLARLPADEFSRLLTPLAARTTPDDRRLLQAAFDIWIELDPAAATRWVGEVPASPGLDHLRLARQAGREWAKLDALAAATWACALADDARAQDLARALLPGLAEKDSARALALATARGDAFLDSILPALMEPMAKTDPASALRTYGSRLWKNGEGFYPLRDTIAKWVTREPAAALGWLLAQPRRSDSDISQWLSNLTHGGADSAAIASALVSVPGLPDRQSALGHILFSWGAERPDEALAWLNSLTDRHLRTVLLERAARITFTNNPERSLPLALAMSEGANRTERLSRLLGEWAKKDPSAALAWIREHDEPGVASASASVQAAILANIARDEPATALAEWQALPDGAAKTAALTPIAEAWSATDPGAALQWLAEQEKARQSYTSHENLIYIWAQKDPLAALRWAEEKNQGDMRANYLRAIAGNWQQKANRAATADLYSKIKDQTLRADTLTAHISEWHSKDPAAARAWLEKSSALTPAQAAALLPPAH